ncbi:MAG TPA: alkaline phosphatase family protein [Kofleriaceae bacterium]|nr:alkaline phosphatase family protein [Kofleriaceae bacterium]
MNRALLFLSLLLAACRTTSGAGGAGGAGGGTRPTGGGATTGHSPRLVVVLVVDQFPEWSLEQKAAQLTGGGFARLFAEGEWHVGRHPSAATLTAPGHTLLGTGKPPAYSGILGNEWWSRDEDRVVHAVEEDDPTKFLRVPGLGDAVARAHTGAKAVGVSLKERAARLPLGKHGLAVWYESKTVTWNANGDSLGATTVGPTPAATPASTPTAGQAHPVAHASKLPAWLAKLPPIAPRITTWTPLDAAKLATLSGVVDEQPGEHGEKGFGPTFPHDPQATKDAGDAVFAMPLGNELVLDTALAAIDGEGLGKDATPDLLFVSLSANDYIAHGWGHESWESWDSLLRLDTKLASFLDELDKRVGANNWALITTSDHGGAPMPEKLDGGRLTWEQLLEATNNAAVVELGPGNWVASAHYPFVFLTKAALAQPKRSLAIVIKKIEYALRSFPGIARAGRVDTYAGNCETRTGDEKALCLTFDPQRSGEIFYMPARGWILMGADDHYATAHGSLNDYDRDVPVVLLPFGRTKHAPDAKPRDEVPLEDVAALVSAWLGVAPP